MNYYIHVPFCRNKCGYCVFYSITNISEGLINAYLDELEHRLSVGFCGEAETIFIGGGTPSCLGKEGLLRLFDLVKRFLKPNSSCEITIEANPESLTGEIIDILRENVSRLSIGVQSFSPVLRQRLQRQCDDDTLQKVLKNIAEAKFRHCNIDLIYAVPGETKEEWLSDLIKASECGIDHISAYSLTPEEGSKLGGGYHVDDDFSAWAWRAAGRLLRRRGFARYEVSNYAKSNGRCRHNVAVWRGGLLKGFGPSAAGFNGYNRLIEPSSLDAWLGRDAEIIDSIPPGRRINEIFAVNLRTVIGWVPELWKQVPGADSWEERIKFVNNCCTGSMKNFLHITSERICLTEQGLLYWDAIAEKLL